MKGRLLYSSIMLGINLLLLLIFLLLLRLVPEEVLHHLVPRLILDLSSPRHLSISPPIKSTPLSPSTPTSRPSSLLICLLKNNTNNNNNNFFSFIFHIGSGFRFIGFGFGGLIQEFCLYTPEQKANKKMN